MKKIIIICLTTILSSICYANTNFDKNEQLNQVFMSHLINAKKGSVESQKYTGAYYYFGHDGVTKDYKKAFEWFEKAANSDDSQSQEMIAYMYSVGQHVKIDEIKAQQWNKKFINTKERYINYYDNCIKFKTRIECKEQTETLASWKKQELYFLKNLKKAKLGNSISQYITSRNYLYGEGTKSNTLEAINWLIKSSYNNNPLAAYNLACLFFLAKGVSPDFLEFMTIAEHLKDEDAILIMKIIRLDERNYHLENYEYITKMLKPFIVLK